MIGLKSLVRIYWAKLSSQSFWLDNIQNFLSVWIFLDTKPNYDFKNLKYGHFTQIISPKYMLYAWTNLTNALVLHENKTKIPIDLDGKVRDSYL